MPLTYELKNGEQVDVLTAKTGGPSRDWLSPHLGYVKTNRARAKIRQWFIQQDQDKASSPVARCWSGSSSGWESGSSSWRKRRKNSTLPNRKSCLPPWVTAR